MIIIRKIQIICCQILRHIYIKHASACHKVNTCRRLCRCDRISRTRICFTYYFCQIYIVRFDYSRLFRWLLNCNINRTCYFASICRCCSDCCCTFCTLLSYYSTIEVYSCYIFVAGCPFNDLTCCISRCNCSRYSCSLTRSNLCLSSFYINTCNKFVIFNFYKVNSVNCYFSTRRLWAECDSCQSLWVHSFTHKHRNRNEDCTCLVSCFYCVTSSESRFSFPNLIICVGPSAFVCLRRRRTWETSGTKLVISVISTAVHLVL